VNKKVENWSYLLIFGISRLVQKCTIRETPLNLLNFLEIKHSVPDFQIWSNRWWEVAKGIKACTDGAKLATGVTNGRRGNILLRQGFGRTSKNRLLVLP